MRIYATYDRSTVADDSSYRVSFRNSDALDARSTVVRVESLDAAHAYLTDNAMTYVKNMKAAKHIESELSLQSEQLSFDDVDDASDDAQQQLTFDAA